MVEFVDWRSQSQNSRRASVSRRVKRQENINFSVQGNQARGISSSSWQSQLLSSSQGLNCLDETYPHQGGIICFTLLIQMLISSKSTLTEIPRIMFEQISEHPMAPVKLIYKINHHTCPIRNNQPFNSKPDILPWLFFTPLFSQEPDIVLFGSLLVVVVAGYSPFMIPGLICYLKDGQNGLERQWFRMFSSATQS